MLPSQSWTDAITMPHHVEWVRVRDPGPKEGEACHYSTFYYPYQREEGRRHCLGPCQQNGANYCHSVEEETPPQGPYLVGPPEPFSEVSNKQMYLAYMNLVQDYKTVKLCKTMKTFTSEVKVAPLTYLEELLIRNRAMCLILCLGHIFFVVLVKTAPLLRLKSIVFRQIYYAISGNLGSNFPMFL